MKRLFLMLTCTVNIYCMNHLMSEPEITSLFSKAQTIEISKDKIEAIVSTTDLSVVKIEEFTFMTDGYKKMTIIKNCNDEERSQRILCVEGCYKKTCFEAIKKIASQHKLLATFFS